MFRVEFFVDDKKLGAALLALVGLANGQPGVTPVVNAKMNGHGVVAEVNGSTLDRFTAALKTHSGKTINASDVRAMMKPIGLAEKSYSYMLKKAVAAKLVKKTGSGQGTQTRYAVA